jgi:cell division protein FtsB
MVLFSCLTFGATWGTLGLEAPTVNDKLRIPQPFIRILFILVVVLIGYLVVSFVRQVAVSQQRKEELGRLDEAVAAALAEQSDLEDGLEYAQSVAAVEEWALANGYAPPDEVAVIVVESASSSLAGSQESQERKLGEDAPREAWWELFFGER